MTAQLANGGYEITPRVVLDGNTQNNLKDYLKYKNEKSTEWSPTDLLVKNFNVNPLFRKKNIAKKLLKLVRQKTKKKLIFQKPIIPLGSKLLESIKKWN